MLSTLAQWLFPRNRGAHTKGSRAEKVAFIYLLCKGYTPAPRPVRALAQTDLLLRKGPVLALVEVKYRSTAARGHLALHPAQKARLHRQLWALAARYPGLTLRLDLLLVFPQWPFIQHIPGVDLPAHPTYHAQR